MPGKLKRGGLFAEVNPQAEAGEARRSQRSERGFADFDGAVEEVFAGGVELDTLAEVVGGVGV